MDRTKIFGCLSFLLMLAGCSHQQPLVVGSKNFTEQLILGEIVAQHLEHRINQPVERKLGLAGTLLANQALETHDIDIYPEYTGTAFTNVLKQAPISDPRIVLERVRTEYATNRKIEWLDPLGFDNSFAMVVRGDDARAKHLATLSDAAASPDGFTLAAGYEFMQRPDGYGVLNSVYGIKWKDAPQMMDLGLLYTALKNHKASMVAGNMTDGMLTAIDAKVLADDKHAFPPYQACLVVRFDTLAANPKLRGILSELSGKILTDEMRRMNYEVDGKHRRPEEVAREFLAQRGL